MLVLGYLFEANPTELYRYDAVTQDLSHDHLARVFFSSHLRFANSEWNVLVLDHVHDLSLHCEAEQNDEVHDEDGPEDGHVEELKERAERGDQRSLHGRMPELELGQTSHERTEFVIGFRRKQRTVIVIIVLESRIDRGSEEQEE